MLYFQCTNNWKKLTIVKCEKKKKKILLCDCSANHSTISNHKDSELRLFLGFYYSICLCWPKEKNNNLLLTECEGCTGEYWPQVVTVRTERSEVCTKTTEGQYSPVRPEQARLVSSLLYGTLLLIVKCTSGGLHLKNVRLLHPSLKFRKNFNLFSFCWYFQCEEWQFSHFFFAVLVANVEFAGFAPKQKYTDWTVSMETVRTAKSWPRKNQSEHRD